MIISFQNLTYKYCGIDPTGDMFDDIELIISPGPIPTTICGNITTTENNLIEGDYSFDYSISGISAPDHSLEELTVGSPDTVSVTVSDDDGEG